MKTPLIPTNEDLRLKTLQSLNVLDTPAEERFDRLTRIVAKMFDVSISLVSLIDSNRQWFKSCVGLNAKETPRDISFCGHSILQNDLLVVEDALEDERFFDNPLVTADPKIRFYVGAQLTHPNGSKLGTLCLIDPEPKTFTPADAAQLKQIAHLVELELLNNQSLAIDKPSGLSDDTTFVLLAKQSLAQCLKLKAPYTLAYIECPQLLTLKHQRGQEAQLALIKIITQNCRSTLRSSDVIARYSESAFTAFFSNMNLQNTAQEIKLLADKIQIDCDQENLHITFEYRLGLASQSEPSSLIEDLIYQAFSLTQKAVFSEK